MKKTTFVLFILLAMLLSSCQLPLIGTRSTPLPTMFVPTPDCGSPTLELGASKFQIQNLSPAAVGSLSVPPDTSGTAYWLEGTDTNYVFLINASPENLAILPTISAGSPAKVTWENCNSSSYTLSAGQPGALDIKTLSDQSAEGITIIFQTDTSGAGTVFNGGFEEQQINTFSTPDLSQGVQAEIGLLETTPSKDGTSIQTNFSVYNFGTTPFTLTANDVSLTPTGGSPMGLTNSKPSLPKEITPGKTAEFTFTFPRPTTPTATIKLFTVEYDVEGY
jgi:hypothetical protein